MRVLTAEELGFCFGVRDALALTRAVPDPENVTIHGELVHNEVVLDELAARGFAVSPEATRGVPTTPKVLVTAHGISDTERDRLLAAGKTLIDTTCPLVRRAHEAARKLAADGWFVVVLGKPGHVEVRGLVEDLPRHAVVPDADAIVAWPEPRIGVVCQTTVPIRTARELTRRIRIENPDADVRFVDTVCEPTKRRIAAVEALAGRVDAFVIVGGKRSNNTQELVRLCERLGVRTLHVTSAAELDAEWFAGCATVGLGAGTSTLDTTIAEVRAVLEGFGSAAASTG